MTEKQENLAKPVGFVSASKYREKTIAALIEAEKLELRFRTNVVCTSHM